MTLPTPTQATPEAGDTARYRAVLNTLIDQGAAIAARIAASATAASTPDSALPEAAIAFERAARCVRRTIALAQHIEAPAPRPAATRDGRTRARTHLIRTVEDAIHVEARVYGGDKDALDREFAERLNDPALEFEFGDRDIETIIQEICQDLGIGNRRTARIWRRRTPQDIKDLRTRAAAPAPAAHGPATRPPDQPPNLDSLIHLAEHLIRSG